VQCSAFTAASAAARVEYGSEPMMLCSRFDLFHTGITSAPAFCASMQACSWVLVCFVIRRRPPRENFPSWSALMMSSVMKAVAMGPETEGRVGDEEDFFSVDGIESLLQLFRVVAALHLGQIAPRIPHTLDLFFGEMPGAPAD